MRYDEFRDRWQAALRDARVLGHHDRPEETIDLVTTARQWRLSSLPLSIAPFSVGATTSFLWDPFASARSYTREDDLVAELFGRTPRRSTQPSWLRVDIVLHAALAHGQTVAMPPGDIWAPWVESAERRLDHAVAVARQRKGVETVWRGELEIEARTTAAGSISLHALSIPAYEIVVIPRIWDDPRRQAREPSADRRIDALAHRFRAALDAWAASIREIVGWMRHSPEAVLPGSRRPARREKRDGPETTH